MSWNGSSSAGASVPAPKKPAKKSPGLTHGLIAGGAIVLIGVISLYFVTSEPDEQPVEKKGPSQIADAEPDVATNVTTVAEAPVKEKWTPENDRVHRDAYGRVIYDESAPKGSKANPIKHDVIRTPGNRVPPRKLYGTFSENYIVGLMRTKPGMRVVGTRLPNNFDEEFKATIADPIRYDDEDTEEDKQLRLQMKEFKKQMAALIAEGKSPSEIILEERNELNKIADNRSVIAKELSAMRRNGASEEDLEDAVAAANVIMERYGAKGFMTKRQLIEQFYKSKEDK